jgi:hypothetical protein
MAFECASLGELRNIMDGLSADKSEVELRQLMVEHQVAGRMQLARSFPALQVTEGYLLISNHCVLSRINFCSGILTLFDCAWL